MTINELVDIVAEIAGIEVTRNHDLSAPQGVRGRNSDNTMIERAASAGSRGSGSRRASSRPTAGSTTRSPAGARSSSSGLNPSESRRSTWRALLAVAARLRNPWRYSFDGGELRQAGARGQVPFRSRSPGSDPVTFRVHTYTHALARVRRADSRAATLFVTPPSPSSKKVRVR